ncbi:hypothetical protein BLD44_029470 [Mastigocladus laminosus UU774]|nr:hypothetical protein BLD44_029470 [Mastigocladus laminosus UU774]
MIEQHYRMTLNDAIALYKSNDLTAKGALKIWVRIRFKTGWEGFIDTKELRELFDMRRSTFWEALGKLEEEGEIELSEPHKIHIKRLSDSSGIPDDESLKPSQQAESSEPPDLIQDLYQSFINSLSEGERESFLKFGSEKAAKLPSPPQLPRKWIEANFEELAAQWRKTPSGAATNSKWENDPRHQEWMDKIRSLGFGAFIYESGKRDKEREEFFRWANANNLIWGAES